LYEAEAEADRWVIIGAKMDKTSVLSLHLEKGPRQGEVLDCKKRAKVTIGRVVKSNTLAIKEDGISQRHLSIESKDNKWTVTDLGSSNGTILNDDRLLPNKPCPLKNGDAIKIGEETLIRVNIESQGSPEKKTLRPQAGRKRGEAATAKKQETVVQNPAPPQSVVASTGKSAESVNSGAECSRKGLEDMTLEEWFDQMEQWLPQHLTEVSENIIGQMRARSEQFDAYILQKDPNNGQ
jgi:pSer/pThr/pTyr-binding forkhead associated (FHA) protein